MVRIPKNTLLLLLVTIISIATTAEAQAGSWYPSPNLNLIHTQVKNGNVNIFLNQSPLQFVVVAAFQQVVSLQTNHDIWIVVKVSKRKTKICHIKGSKQNNKNHINVNWIRCYKCKKSKNHHSTSYSHSHHSHSRHFHSSYSSHSSFSHKTC